VVRFLAGAGGLFLIHSVQTGSGVHPSSKTVRTGSALPGVKRPRRETDIYYLVLVLRMNGDVLPLLHITLWSDQRNLSSKGKGFP